MNGNVCGGVAEILLSAFGAISGLAILIVSGFGSAFGLILLTACCARIAFGFVGTAHKNKGKGNAEA